MWVISKDDPNKINLNKLVTGEDANTVLLTCRKGREVQVKIKDSGEVVEVQKVLGMNWNYCEDSVSYKVNLNFSKKKGNCRSEPNLLEQDVPNKIPECLTKRMILSQINGFFDPLGLVKAKILWRKLWMGKTKGWDDPISPELQREWCSFFKEMFIIEKIKFERCTKPPNATDNPPILILFSDASINAYGTCAYIRWELHNGHFSSCLVPAKCRVTPIKRISIVRLEMNGALLAKRLKVFIEKETRIKFARVYFFVDSEIVVAMLQKESYGFSTYIGLRVGEIQQATESADWFWIEGRLNIADWITKGKSPIELIRDSQWQNGPKFLTSHEKTWPIHQNCTVLEIPERIQMVMVTDVRCEDKLANRICIHDISKYLVLIRTTTRVLSMYNKCLKASLMNAIVEPKSTDYDKAGVPGMLLSYLL